MKDGRREKGMKEERGGGMLMKKIKTEVKKKGRRNDAESNTDNRTKEKRCRLKKSV
jgi:hypothetical protein